MERDHICLHGDLLERHIFASEEFASAFDLYPIVWTRHVLPNRESGRIGAVPAWRAFAQHHYAAIIRCWSMFETKNTIAERARSWDKSTPSILRFHADLVSYYTFSGSVIDNLDKCFKALGSRQSAKEVEELGVSFDRRNKEVHDGIRPIFDFCGSPAFDASLYSMQHKLWEDGTAELTELSRWIEDEWVSFIKGTRAAWSQLLTTLQTSPHVPVATAKLPSLLDLPPATSHAGSGQPDF